MRMRHLLLIALLSLLGACTWFHNEPFVMVTSDPPGAQILINGLDSGLTTPSRLNLGTHFGGHYQIELVKPGHRPERRLLVQYTEGYTSKWIDGAYEDVLPPLPFFWTTGDMLLPFALYSTLVPGELHCKLYPVDAPLLGFELLQQGRGSTPLQRP